ncbi:MAG: hypothetical protein ABEJ86_06230 [Halococcoides sp.]
MTRRSALLVAVIVVAALGSVPVGSAAGGPSIEGVTLSPAPPIAGSPVTMTVTVAAPANTSGTLTDVYVRGREGTDLARVENVGSVDAGGSVAVPLSLTLAETGPTRLHVHAVMVVDGESRSVSTTRIVDVRDSGNVLLSMPHPDPVAGAATTVDVGVANGAAEPITSVELELSGNVTVENPRRVTASIGGRTDRTFSFDVRFPETGTYELAATLTYETTSGDRRTVSRTVTIEATETGGGPGLEGGIELTELRTSAGNVVTVEGNIANVGGQSVRSVLMHLEDTESVTPREGSGEYFVGTINASTFETFELVGTADGDPPSTVTVAVEYITDGQRRTTTFDLNVSGGAEPMPDDRGGPNERFGRDRPMPDRADPDPGGGVLAAVLGLLGPVLFLGGVIVVGGLGYVLWSRR